MSSPTPKNRGMSKCPSYREEYSALKTNVPFPVALAILKTKILLEPFIVRVHSKIGRKPWARLWYECRGFDIFGSGHVELPLETLQHLLGVSDKTIYRWLAQGEAKGAFRKYWVSTGVLTVYLGSLTRVCWELNIRDWGEVGECLLPEVNRNLRAQVTGIVTQKLQQQSRYAANRKLKPEYRKHFGAPHPNELLGQLGQSSLKSDVGEVPCVLHISDTRIFVSKNFVVFGANQKSIAEKLELSDRTVRRHHKITGVVKRQICQKKRDYAWIPDRLDHECSSFFGWEDGDPNKPSHIGYRIEGEKLLFSDGIPMGSRKKEVNQYTIPTQSFRDRFFKVGKQTFMAKTNVYREEVHLTTMRASRRKWRKFLASQTGTVTVSAKNEPPGVSTVLK